MRGCSWPRSDGRLCQVRGAQPPGVGTNMGRGWRHGLSLRPDPASSGDIITHPVTSGLTHQSRSANIKYLTVLSVSFPFYEIDANLYITKYKHVLIQTIFIFFTDDYYTAPAQAFIV